VQGIRELDWRVCHDIHCKAGVVLSLYPQLFFSSHGIFCRPESIEDGRYRFYASENFPSEATSLSRISKAANDMKSAVVEFADRSMSGPRRWKKPRTDNGSETVNGGEGAVSTVRGVPQNIDSTPVPQQPQAHSTSNRPPSIASSLAENVSSGQLPSGRFLDFLKNPRPSDKMRNPIAKSTISAIPPDNDKTPTTSRSSYIAELAMDKDRMVGFVRQLLSYVLLFFLAFTFAHGFLARAG
jgi:hypothetical protein